MNYWQHILVAFCATHVVNVLLKMPWTPPLFAAVFLGAILPDIDHEKTKIFRFFLVTIFATVFYLAYSTSANVVFSCIVSLASIGAVFLLKPRHRGITHSPISAIVFAFAIYLLTKNPNATLDGLVAYGSHLAADRIRK